MIRINNKIFRVHLLIFNRNFLREISISRRSKVLLAYFIIILINQDPIRYISNVDIRAMAILGPQTAAASQNFVQ